MSQEQVTNINLEHLLDQLRARFRNRIAELEDQSSLQIASLEVALKKVAKERDELAHVIPILQGQIQELEGMLGRANQRVLELTPAEVGVEVEVEAPEAGAPA